MRWFRALFARSSPVVAVFAWDSGSADRFEDCECGAARVLVRGRILSAGCLPAGVQLVAGGVCCPGCGAVVWEPRLLLPSDLDAVAWQLAADSLLLIRAREVALISSYQEQVLLEDRLEHEHWEREQLANEKRFSEFQSMNQLTS